ncbi:MAG: hypothetical protein ACTSUB_10225, partial [Candidatus Thorarchaeota archaeon]
YALTGKFAAILGPLVYMAMLNWSKNMGYLLAAAHRNAMLSILALFVISLIILVKVRQPVMGASTSIYLEDDIGPGM